MKKTVLVFMTAILLLTMLMSGCLGAHETCPECDGSGREKWTLWITECENCDGDGEVGLFMDDEDAEDGMSALLVVVIIIVIVVGIVMAASKKAPPSQQPQQYQQPYQQQPPPPPDYRPPQVMQCRYCSALLPLGSDTCLNCGRQNYQ